jgi:hypothetical protein
MTLNDRIFGAVIFLMDREQIKLDAKQYTRR